MKIRKFRYLDNNSTCYECGKDLIAASGGINLVFAQACAHEEAHAGYCRKSVQCSKHNYGNVVVFEGDREY